MNFYFLKHNMMFFVYGQLEWQIEHKQKAFILQESFQTDHVESG